VATGGYDVAGSGQGRGLIETLSRGTWTASAAPLPPDASNPNVVLPSVAWPMPGHVRGGRCLRVGLI